jgi:hypothetical protein
MKKAQRTTTTSLTGATVMSELQPEQLLKIAGGVNHNTKWSFRAPQDPDDIYRLVDE